MGLIFFFEKKNATKDSFRLLFYSNKKNVHANRVKNSIYIYIHKHFISFVKFKINSLYSLYECKKKHVCSYNCLFVFFFMSWN